MKAYLESLVKDDSDLVSIDNLDPTKNTTTVTLKNGTYLGKVFKQLPHGIINKTEIGIGATRFRKE